MYVTLSSPIELANGESIWITVDFYNPSGNYYIGQVNGLDVAGFTSTFKNSEDGGVTWNADASYTNDWFGGVTKIGFANPEYPDPDENNIVIGQIGTPTIPIDENTTGVTTGTPGANQVQLVPVHTGRLD